MARPPQPERPYGPGDTNSGVRPATSTSRSAGGTIPRVRTIGSIVPQPARRLAAGVGLGSLGVVLVLALSTGASPSTSVDRLVDGWVAAWATPLRPALDVMTELVSPGVVAAVCLSLCLVCATLREWAAAALFLVGPGAAIVMSDLVLKPVIASPSAAGGFGFPSGHATGVSAVAGVLTLLALPGGVLARRVDGVVVLLVRLAAGLSVGYVALALVALRYHSATEVVAGLAVGLCAVCGCALALDGAAGVRPPRRRSA